MPSKVRKPRFVAVDAHAPDPGALRDAASVLRQGHLVAFPTETVYGLGARALDPYALACVFSAKGRPEHHPLIAHVSTEEEARALAAHWPEAARHLARAFWPGPLTLIVDRAAGVPSAIAGGGSSIAVRMPAHAVARGLVASLGEPIAAPSANRYQGVSPTTAAHVLKELGDRVDLILDGGACSEGIESTVVDVRGAVARVLRPGALSVERVRAILPDVIGSHEEAASGASRASPGMDARHYAPRARLVVVPSHAVAGEVQRERARTEEARSMGVVLRSPSAIAALAPTRSAAAASDMTRSAAAASDMTRSAAAASDMTRSPPCHVLVRELPDEPAAYARLLYATLHELDEAGVEVIVAEAVPPVDAWWAVADRLRRASAGHAPEGHASGEK